MHTISKPKILITSPSINTRDNVSGIANLTHLLVVNNKEVKYSLFTAGKKDRNSRGFLWLVKQIGVLFFFIMSIKQKEISFAHINMPLEKAAILRDASFAMICRFVNKPYIVHLRGGSYSKNLETPQIFKSLIKNTLSRADIIIVLGNDEKKFIHNYYNIEENKIRVIPNSVKVPEFKQKKICKAIKINILYLGRIDKNKGLVEIINALAALFTTTEFTLHVAGDGPDNSWFKEFANNQLKGNFRYEGIVSGASKEKLLSDAHIFLLPSYYEGLPNALLEAMSYGVVPIVTPVGSIPELVIDNENGLIVPVKDHGKIKEAIELLINDKTLYEKLSFQAYKTINGKYSIKEYINKLNCIYRNVVPDCIND